MRTCRATAALVSATCALACAAPALGLTEQAALHASFSPDRLGAPTTIGFSFHLATAEGTAPPPLSSIDLQMPAGINYTSTTLGLAICRPDELIAHGLAGCPANSRLGYGNAVVEVPFGTGAGHEIPEVQALAGPSPNGNLAVLFYANGLYPVDAQLAFTGEVLPDSGRFGSQTGHQRAARRERARRPRRVGRLRHQHDRPESPDLLPPRPRPPRRLPPSRRIRAGTLPARRFPVRGHVHVRGRHEHRRRDDRPLPATAPMSTATHASGARILHPQLEPLEDRVPAQSIAARLGLPCVFARTVACHLLLVRPTLLSEYARWQRAAGQIREAELRRLALASLEKRGNIEGAALLATLAPSEYRRGTVTAQVAFQTLYNYLDALSEQHSEDPRARAEELHEALLHALGPPGATSVSADRSHADAIYVDELLPPAATPLGRCPRTARSLRSPSRRQRASSTSSP